MEFERKTTKCILQLIDRSRYHYLQRTALMMVKVTYHKCKIFGNDTYIEIPRMNEAQALNLSITYQHMEVVELSARLARKRERRHL